MSKAFAKDDGPTTPDVQRRRPPLPGDAPNYVTVTGLRALRDELAALASTGSVGEAEHAALAARRAELEHRVSTAVVAPPPADRAEVRFGARVRVRGADGHTREIRIVGVDEADPAHGLVAFVAPVARALLGRRPGDAVTVRAPGGEDDLEIVSVDYDV
jgi:transcription elongation factor GreB